ncbi:hypothetical protein MG293_018619 [Ovis ammon polii]|uniref:Solute carrier family 22 member 23 n=1 Tax=Ovis ammon polii TaxID=230172 RepID=A0AAD4TQA0_OVIAM|nr:hypothetical protein MG293_018619 [Ovis ammon polii]
MEQLLSRNHGSKESTPLCFRCCGLQQRFGLRVPEAGRGFPLHVGAQGRLALPPSWDGGRTPPQDGIRGPDPADFCPPPQTKASHRLLWPVDISRWTLQTIERPPVWDLVCDNAWKVHVAKFSLLVGLIFGYLITGCIADWFGRRPVLLFSIIFILIFGLTVALSVNVTMFSTLRFFEGFCLAGVTLTLYALQKTGMCKAEFALDIINGFIIISDVIKLDLIIISRTKWSLFSLETI